MQFVDRTQDLLMLSIDRRIADTVDLFPRNVHSGHDESPIPNRKADRIQNLQNSSLQDAFADPKKAIEDA
jgi:hypothetical protein